MTQPDWKYLGGTVTLDVAGIHASRWWQDRATLYGLMFRGWPTLFHSDLLDLLLQSIDDARRGFEIATREGLFYQPDRDETELDARYDERPSESFDGVEEGEDGDEGPEED